MSYRNDNFDSVEDQVDDVVEDIHLENTFIDDIFDTLGRIFYNLFPGLKTAEVEEDLAIIELTEDEGYYIPTVALTESEKKALNKTEEAESATDLFNTLSVDLADEKYQKELKKKLKEIEENRKKVGLD